jgi:hypothetical protein
LDGPDQAPEDSVEEFAASNTSMVKDSAPPAQQKSKLEGDTNEPSVAKDQVDSAQPGDPATLNKDSDQS